MKLVIYTQYQENYIHNSSEQLWKNKGGDTFVYENLSTKDIEDIEGAGDGNFRDLMDKIEYKNSASRTNIMSFRIVEDDTKIESHVYYKLQWHEKLQSWYGLYKNEVDHFAL